MISLDKIIGSIGPLDRDAMAAAQARQNRLTKPRGSLGRLEELSIQLAGIRQEVIARVDRKAIITMAGDHGVASAGVSSYPREVTAQMVDNFLRGGAGVNALGRLVGARVVVVDVGVASELDAHPELIQEKVARGTANLAEGPAMSREEACRALAVGIAVVDKQIESGLDIVGTGDMGIGNTTASSAICAAITGEPVAAITGRGTGIDNAQLAHKVAIIERGLAINRPDPHDPLDVLAKVGGLEIAGLAGVMLGAAARRVPVVVDGFISGAAALIATGLAPNLKDYLIPSHVSAEHGHRSMLRHMGLKPLLDLDMRLGEGTGAALGIFLAEASIRLLAEMATFDEAGVSDKQEG